jgi:hypothetical protein
MHGNASVVTAAADSGRLQRRRRWQYDMLKYKLGFSENLSLLEGESLGVQDVGCELWPCSFLIRLLWT